MKPTILKIPPEIEGQAMASAILTDRQTIGDSALLDFYNNHFVDSSGAVLLAQRILRLLGPKQTRLPIQYYFKPESKCRSTLESIGFFDVIGKQVEENDLFPLQSSGLRCPITTSRGTSFPIYELAFRDYADPREAIPEFRKWILTTLSSHVIGSDFNVGQFVMLLTEIAKNSADHTSGNAYFGIDLERYSKATDLIFSYIDLGHGIHRTVKKYVTTSKHRNRAGHLSVSENYRMALTLGFTSKPDSGINFGLGMGSIIDFARGLDVKLSVFDSQNRVLISEIDNLSHRNIRRNFFDLRTQVGFGYYGQLTIRD